MGLDARVRGLGTARAAGGRLMPWLDLTQEAEAYRVALGEVPELSEPERILVENTWLGRMVNEHASARVFAQLLPQLMRAEISGARQAEVADMIADELRHARACAGVLLSIGTAPRAELPALTPVPDHADVEPLEAVLRNVLSICCLSETVAVSLIGAERLQMEGTCFGEVLTKILADEVRHARFGWKLLEDLELDDGMRARLSDYLRVAFAHLEAHELAHLAPLPAPAGAAAYGACDGRQARDIFFATVEDVIVARLEEHGFSAREAWRRRAA